MTCVSDCLVLPWTCHAPVEAPCLGLHCVGCIHGSKSFLISMNKLYSYMYICILPSDVCSIHCNGGTGGMVIATRKQAISDLRCFPYTVGHRNLQSLTHTSKVGWAPHPTKPDCAQAGRCARLNWALHPKPTRALHPTKARSRICGAKTDGL